MGIVLGILEEQDINLDQKHMAKYGNILTVFNTDNNAYTEIETVLTNNQTDFIKLNDTYFIETNSKKNTSDVLNDLNGVGIAFIFFHNHISDGSQIKSNGIDESNLKNINRILFK